MFIRFLIFLIFSLFLSVSFLLSTYCTSQTATFWNKHNTLVRRNTSLNIKTNVTSEKPQILKSVYPSMLIPPFIPFRSTFVIARNHSIAACRIQKNLSTILLNLFCFLNNPQRFVRSAKSLTVVYKPTLSSKTCNKTHASHIATDSSIKTKLAIIRDPIERFLSAYVDKCIHEAKTRRDRCYGCNQNMLCLLQKQYFRFMKISRGIIKNFSYEDRHFAPMTWFCDFNNSTIRNYKFLVFGDTEKEQSQTIIDLMNEFLKHGVSTQTTAFFLEELSANRTKHSTSGSSIRNQINKEMRSNYDIMEYLYLIYAHDYNVFKLKKPFTRNFTYFE